MKKIFALILTLLILAFSGCEQAKQTQEEEAGKEEGIQENQAETGSETEAEEENQEMAEDGDTQELPKMSLKLSNMANEASLAEVREALLKKIKVENVEAFLRLVKDYNEAVENTGLQGDFIETHQPEYDVAKLGELWAEKKREFIGTNCRINAFTLLKGDMEVNQAEVDDGFLFMDKDAISVGRLFSEEEAALFLRLFSRVKTESTKDIKVHAAKIKAHFEGVKFPEKARMLSLVIHDTLDGDYLFIGHTGVLVEDGEGYLFVEKLAFDQPYQALKFKTKEDCYSYLYNTYKHHRDETSSKPFVLDNSELVELKEYQED